MKTVDLVNVFADHERMAADSNSPRVGEMVLSNEARFNASYYSEPLTAYTVGWKDKNNIEATLDFIAPPVSVGRRYEFKKADNAESFLSEVDDIRSIGADFKRVDYKGSSVNDKTLNKGLTIRIDLDAVAGTPTWREVYTTRLLQRIQRNELRRAVTAVIAAATNTAKTWDTTAGKDPDQDVITDIIAAVDSSGVRPNRLLYGDIAWNKRLISHRAQTSAGGYASSSMTPDEVAGFMGMQGVMVSRERYQSGTTTKGKITPDVVIEFYAEYDMTPEDPSNTKRFWTPCDGGTKFRVYEQQVSAKFIDLTVEHYSNVTITSTVGLRTLTIS